MVKMKKTKNKNEFTVTLKVTEGGVLALYHALEKHEKDGSSIAGDIKGFLVMAAKETGLKL